MQQQKILGQAKKTSSGHKSASFLISTYSTVSVLFYANLEYAECIYC